MSFNGAGNHSGSFTVTNIQVSAGGTQLTASVKIDASVKPGAWFVTVTTPNGDSTGKRMGAAVFVVTP